jgi:hypothetical protein
MADPSGCAVYSAYCLGPLEYWDYGSQSRSRHGRMATFFYIMFLCVGRDSAMGRSPVQGDLLKCLKRFIVSDVNSKPEVAIFLHNTSYNVAYRYSSHVEGQSSISRPLTHKIKTEMFLKVRNDVMSLDTLLQLCNMFIYVPVADFISTSMLMYRFQSQRTPEMQNPWIWMTEVMRKIIGIKVCDI